MAVIFTITNDKTGQTWTGKADFVALGAYNEEKPIEGGAFHEPIIEGDATGIEALNVAALLANQIATADGIRIGTAAGFVAVTMIEAEIGWKSETRYE